MFSTVGSRARELHLPIWSHAGHPGVSEPTYSRWACWFCLLVHLRWGFPNNWKTNGVVLILEGNFLGEAKFFLGGAVLGVAKFPSLYIIHQGEMNTRICQRSILAEVLARPAFLSLRVQYLVATPLCVKIKMWSGGLFLLLLNKEQGHHCIFNFLLLYLCPGKTL